MSEHPIRVAVVGLGPIGTSIYRMLQERSWVEVVGAVDVAQALVGHDAGSYAGMAPSGRQIVQSLDDLGTGGDVVVVSTSSRLPAAMPTILDAVDAGWDVLSTCEELVFPQLRHPAEAARIDERARAAGRTVLGTGINPGFAMDAAVLYLSGVVDRVDTVDVVRVVDAATRRLPLRAKVGLGITVDEYEARLAAATIGHVGLAESAALLAVAFGWPVDTVAESVDPVLAEKPVTVDGVDVARGAVLGIRQTATVSPGGVRRVALRLDMYTGAPDPGDRITLTGSSTITQRIDGIHGDTATAAVVVNTIPTMETLPAGLVTMADVALVRSRPDT